MRKAFPGLALGLASALLMGGGLFATPSDAAEVKVYSAPPQSVEELEAALGIKKGAKAADSAQDRKGPKMRGIIMGDPAQIPTPPPSQATQPAAYAEPAPVQQPYQAPAQQSYQAPAPQPYQAPIQQTYQPPAQQQYQASPPAFIQAAPAPVTPPQAVATYPVTPAQPVMAAPTAEPQGNAVALAITFDVNSATIKPASQGYLIKLAGVMHQNPGLRMVIEGHTDASGNYLRNLDLSKARAQSVSSELASRYGIAASRLTSLGKGPTEPLDPNNPFDAANRRVQVRVME